MSPAPRADSLLVEPSGKLSFREKMPTDRDGLGFLNVLVLRSLCFFFSIAPEGLVLLWLQTRGGPALGTVAKRF